MRLRAGCRISNRCAASLATAISRSVVDSSAARTVTRFANSRASRNSLPPLCDTAFGDTARTAAIASSSRCFCANSFCCSVAAVFGRFTDAASLSTVSRSNVCRPGRIWATASSPAVTATMNTRRTNRQTRRIIGTPPRLCMHTPQTAAAFACTSSSATIAKSASGPGRGQDRCTTSARRPSQSQRSTATATAGVHEAPIKVSSIVYPFG